MTLLDHAKSLASLTVITLNLVLWLVPLVLLSLVKLVLPGARRRVDPLLDGVYRSAVRVDDAWLRGVMRIDWLGMPISSFGLSMVLIGVTILVYLRISRRVSRRYGRPMARSA